MAKPSPELRAVLMASTSPLLEEREELLATIRQAIERIGYIDQKVIAAAIMLDEPPPFLAPIPGALESAEPDTPVVKRALPAGGMPRTWRDFILAVLKDAEHGLTNSEIIDRAGAIGLDHWATRFRKSPNGYFAALRILEAEQNVMRRGMLRYLPDLYHRLETGELTEPPRAATDKAAGGVAGVVLAVVAAQGPATTKQIIQRLRADPETAEIAELRINTVYAVISKLASKDELLRDAEGRYRLPSQPAPEDAANVVPLAFQERGQR